MPIQDNTNLCPTVMIVGDVGTCFSHSYDLYFIRRNLLCTVEVNDIRNRVTAETLIFDPIIP